MDCPRCGREADGGRSFCGWCGASLDGAEPVPPTISRPVPPPPRPGLFARESFALILVHGVAYSALGFLLGLLLTVLTVILALCGWVIGLIIALAVIVLAYGYLNTFINQYVWDEEMRADLASVFLHGIILTVVLLVARVPALFLEAATDDLLVSVAIFVVYVPIYGYAARWVAQMFLAGPERRSVFWT